MIQTGVFNFHSLLLLLSHTQPSLVKFCLFKLSQKPFTTKLSQILCLPFFFFGIAPDLFFAKSKTEHVGFYICTGLTSFSKVEGRCPSFTLTLEERRFVTYELKLTSYLWVTPPLLFSSVFAFFAHTVSLIYSSYGFLTRLRCTMSMFTSLYGRL